MLPNGDFDNFHHISPIPVISVIYLLALLANWEIPGLKIYCPSDFFSTEPTERDILTPPLSPHGKLARVSTSKSNSDLRNPGRICALQFSQDLLRKTNRYREFRSNALPHFIIHSGAANCSRSPRTLKTAS